MKKLIIPFLLIVINCSAQHKELPEKTTSNSHISGLKDVQNCSKEYDSIKRKTQWFIDTGRWCYDTVKIRMLIDYESNTSIACFTNGYMVRRFYIWGSQTVPYGNLYDLYKFLEDDKKTELLNKQIWKWEFRNWIKKPQEFEFWSPLIWKPQ